MQEHKNSRFNIVQAESNKSEFVVIDGQRLSGGYAAPGAKVISQPMSRANAIASADLLQKIADNGKVAVEDYFATLPISDGRMHFPRDPVTGEPTNDARANWAKDSLDLFAYKTCMDTAGEDDQTILTDLLANLMHLADRDGLNWMDAIAHAVEHFNFEKENES